MPTPRCRTCRTKDRSLKPNENCANCVEYGEYFNSVSNRSPEEVTRTIDTEALVAKVERGTEDVLLVLHSSETHRSSVSRWFSRGNKPDFMPYVVAATPDEVGVGFELRDHSGASHKLWRPYRMDIELMIGGVPIKLVPPAPSSPTDDSTTI